VNRRHVVWDWNGTLLDDLAIVVESVNAGLTAYGADPIDEDGYRTHYTRPVSRFYEALLGRPVATEEWLHINDLFHQAYFARVGTVGLTRDARQALDLVESAGVGQSVLSMAPHDHLVPIVTQHRLHEYFTAVRGSSGNRGDEKAAALVDHLEDIGVEPAQVVVIGDTPDDAAAAAHVGAGSILYDGGSHHLVDLEAVGAPIAATLTAAVRIALD
jgi:phosphoglycolate phosphatase-like HAD superfamily hydrolase